MIIAQITDPHIRSHGEEDPWTRGSLRADSNKCLSLAIERINGIKPQPDVLLITGDLTSEGAPGEYQELKRILAKCQIPFFVVNGNHDKRSALRAELDYAHVREHKKFVQYAINQFPIRIIGVDTVSEPDGGGEFCAERQAWLEKCLAEDRTKPTLIALHHPPFNTGVAPMDTYGSSWADGLNRIIAGAPNIERVICGHIHRALHVNHAKTTMSVCPASWWFQVRMELDATVPMVDFMKEGFGVLEPPQFQLHIWNGKYLVTHSLFVEEYARIPLPKHLIDAVAQKMQNGERMTEEDLGDVRVSGLLRTKN